MAVGYYSNAIAGAAPPAATAPLPLAEAWDGKSWAPQEPPNLPGTAGGSLIAVSCASATCMAIGYSTKGASKLPLTELWDGRAWVAQTPPNPAGATGSTLSAVSCTSGSACVAVGYYTMNRNGNPSPNQPGSIPLAESWDGSKWTVQPVPDPAGASSRYLTGVSCTSSRACQAVGGSLYDANPPKASIQALSASRHGNKWTVQLMPEPAGDTNTILTALSCAPAGTCTAIGYLTRGFSGMPLVEAWDGKSWAVLPSPSSAGALSIGFANLSCTSALDCMAVGDYTTKASTLPAAASWDGLSWSVGSPRSPAGAKTTSLTDVSCTSAHACIAVGSSAPSETVALAESWDGQTWTIQPLRLP
jgi:hypothetical protein